MTTILPAPDILAAEIIEDLQSALEELRAISDDLALAPGAQEGDPKRNDTP